MLMACPSGDGASKALFAFFLMMFCLPNNNNNTPSLRHVLAEEEKRCTVCKDGSAITIPGGKIGATHPLPIDDCETLDSIVGYFPSDSQECLSSQALASICGCPIDQNACHLCGTDGSKQNNPDYILYDDTNAAADADDDRLQNNPSGLIIPEGITYNCRMAEAFLYSLHKDDDQCSNLVNRISKYCCDQNITNTTTTTSISPNEDETLPATTSSSGSNFNKCSPCHPHGFLQPDLLIQMHNTSFTCQEASYHFSKINKHNHNSTQDDCQLIQDFCACQPRCNLCPFGETVPLPDKPVTSKSLAFPGYFNNCAQFQEYLWQIRNDSKVCRASHLFSSLCGCAKRTTACHVCENDQKIPESFSSTQYHIARGNVQSVLPDYLQGYVHSKSLQCGTFEAIQAQLYDQDDMLCYIGKFKGNSCGCHNTNVITMIWTQRAASTVSALSSLYIILHIIITIFFMPRHHRHHSRTYYHDLVLGLSVFDLLKSIALAFSTLPMPEDSANYLARGTEFTCKLQAFFVQLGLTTIFYNAVLALFFFILTALPNNKRLYRLFEVSSSSLFFIILFHGCLVGLGLGLAFAGIPFYNTGLTNCQIVSPPIAFTWGPILSIFIVPIGLMTVSITGLLIWLGWSSCNSYAGSGGGATVGGGDDLKNTNINVNTNIDLEVVALSHMDTSSSMEQPHQQQQKQQRIYLFRRSCLYGLIYWLVWPPQLLGFASSLDSNKLPSWLYVVTLMISNSQGTLNMIAYNCIVRFVGIFGKNKERGGAIQWQQEQEQEQEQELDSDEKVTEEVPLQHQTPLQEQTPTETNPNEETDQTNPTLMAQPPQPQPQPDPTTVKPIVEQHLTPILATPTEAKPETKIVEEPESADSSPVVIHSPDGTAPIPITQPKDSGWEDDLYDAEEEEEDPNADDTDTDDEIPPPIQIPPETITVHNNAQELEQQIRDRLQQEHEEVMAKTQAQFTHKLQKEHQAAIAQLQTQMDQVNTQLAHREHQMAERAQQFVDLQTQYETEKEELRRKIQDTKEEAKRRIQKARERVESMEASMMAKGGKAAEELMEKEKVMVALREEGQKLAQKQSDMEKALRSARGEARELITEVDTERNQKEKALDKIASLEADLKRTKEDLSYARKGESQASKLDNELSKIREECDKLETANLSLQQQVKELKETNKDLRKEMEAVHKGAMLENKRESNKLKREHGDMLSEMELKLRTAEREAGIREDALRQEVTELRKRWQDAVRRADVLSMDVQNSTAPLLRQMESLERQSRARASGWAELETKLRSDLEERILEVDTLTKERNEYRSSHNQLNRLSKSRNEELSTSKVTMVEQRAKIEKLESQLQEMESESNRLKENWAEVERLANEGVSKVRSDMMRTVMESEERHRAQLASIENELKDEKSKRTQLEKQVSEMLETAGMMVVPTPQPIMKKHVEKKLRSADGQANILAGALAHLDDDDDNDDDEDDMEEDDMGENQRGNASDNNASGISSFAAMEQLSQRLKESKVELEALKKSLAASERVRESLVSELGEARQAREKLPLFEAKVQELAQDNRQKEFEIRGLQEDIADIRHLYRMQLNGLLEEKAANIMENEQRPGAPAAPDASNTTTDDGT